MARVLSFPLYSDAEVRVRKCISDNNYIRNSVFFRARLVVDVGVGCSRGRDRLRARSLARRRDMRWSGSMPLQTCHRRLGTPLRAACNQDECPPAEIARQVLGCSFYCETQVLGHNCISDDNYVRKSTFLRAGVVVYAEAGYSRGHDRLRACSLSGRRDLRRYGTRLVRTCPCRSPLPLFWRTCPR